MADQSQQGAEMELEECALEGVNEIESELRAYICAESNKVCKIACATILASVSKNPNACGKGSYEE